MTYHKTDHSKILDTREKLEGGGFAVFSASVSSVTAQARQARQETESLVLPRRFRQTTHAVINGMGGSGLGADIVCSVFADQLRRPVTLTHDYVVPGSVGPKTFYLASSYSGNTEEILTAAVRARQRRANVAVLTTGGKLAAFARRHRLPGYIFTPRHNPSGQPRLGLGYSVVGHWALLRAAALLPSERSALATFCTAMEAASRRFSPDVATAKNPAKQLAQTLHGRVGLVIAAPPLAGVAHAFANSCHESAKHFVSYAVLPELNHHLLEGLSHPRPLAGGLLTIFLESPLDPQPIQRRSQVTRQVFRRQGVATFRYRARGTANVAVAAEVLQLALHASWYLAALNRVDPQRIPWVDYFKLQLAKAR